jgi:alkylhydroperoxidase family enzyme
VASHTAVAVAASGAGRGATVKAVLTDWRTAPVDARLRGALAFLEKLTLAPDALGAADVRAARAAGICDAALREAIYVCFLFSVMDRLADSFGFEVPAANELKWGEWILRHFGYHRMSVPG